MILESIRGIAAVRAKQGNLEKAYELLLSVINHPAIFQETRDQAEQLRVRLVPRITADQNAQIQEQARLTSLDKILGSL